MAAPVHSDSRGGAALLVTPDQVEAALCEFGIALRAASLEERLNIKIVYYQST
jgi:hypothetical protein